MGLQEFIIEYYNYGNLHPIVYIKRSKSHLEKLFWISILLCLIAFAFYLSLLQWFAYSEDMVERYLDKMDYPLWMQPFPSVAICNHNIVYKKNTGNITKLLSSHGHSNEAIADFFQNLNNMIICSNCTNSNFDTNKYKLINDLLNREGYTSERLMLELAQPCEEMLAKCYWINSEKPCSELFKMIRTRNGYCCAFNYIGTSDKAWKAINNDDIRYSGGIGLAFGLSVVLRPEESQYVSAIKQQIGFTLNIHSSYEFPGMRQTVKSLLANKGMSIGVTATSTVSDPNIRSIPPHKRECLFKNEGSLKWSKVYTYENCLNECRSWAIFDFCKCVPYMFPQNTSRTCSVMDVPCYQAYKHMASGIVNTYFQSDAENAALSNMRLVKKCACMETCDDTDYTTTSDGYIAYKTAGFENETTSILNVYWNDIKFNKTIRKIKYSWNLLLAYIGGIFGFCLGGSVISIIEIVYHVFCNICKNTSSKYPKKWQM